jgi:hypothetical protein
MKHSTAASPRRHTASGTACVSATPSAQVPTPSRTSFMQPTRRQLHALSITLSIWSGSIAGCGTRIRCHRGWLRPSTSRTCTSSYSEPQRKSTGAPHHPIHIGIRPCRTVHHLDIHRFAFGTKRTRAMARGGDFSDAYINAKPQPTLGQF